MFSPLLARTLAAAFLLSLSFPASADEPATRWLVEYDGAKLPAPSVWTPQGKPETELANGALLLADRSTAEGGAFRASWKTEPGMEVVVEVTMRFKKAAGAVAKKPESSTVWPWRDGGPVSLLVSDGRHQEGLVFFADRVTTWTDRFLFQDAASDFHTYQLVIRESDMSVSADGQPKIRGEGAFWKLAPSAEPFIQFGSSALKPTGEAEWRSVRLGLRKAAAPAPAPQVKVTLSEPWPIERPELKIKPTRPYVYNMGGGRLLMSQAQGPDASWEPYGVVLSTDEGKTWQPIEGLDQTEFAPLPMLPLKSGGAVGMSRWTRLQPDGFYIGHTVRWGADLLKFTMAESRLVLPNGYRPADLPFLCERHVYEDDDGALIMVGYSKTGPATPAATQAGRRYTHLLRSTDGGLHWQPYAIVGPGGEPAVVRTGGNKMTAILRSGGFRPYALTFSEDRGKTWSPITYMEEGSVCPDLCLMSNGLLACSYGRPANGIMFSADGGHTWMGHHIITDKNGFNYSGIVEVRPGRLLYLHDGGGLQGLYIDVERLTH